MKTLHRLLIASLLLNPALPLNASNTSLQDTAWMAANGLQSDVVQSELQKPSCQFGSDAQTYIDDFLHHFTSRSAFTLLGLKKMKLHYRNRLLTLEDFRNIRLTANLMGHVRLDELSVANINLFSHADDPNCAEEYNRRYFPAVFQPRKLYFGLEENEKAFTGRPIQDFINSVRNFYFLSMKFFLFEFARELPSQLEMHRQVDAYVRKIQQLEEPDYYPPKASQEEQSTPYNRPLLPPFLARNESFPEFDDADKLVGKIRSQKFVDASYQEKEHYMAFLKSLYTADSQSSVSPEPSPEP